MRRLALLVLLTGCQSTQGSFGTVFQPEAPTVAPAVAPAAAPDAAPLGPSETGFSFDEDAPEDAAPDRDLDAAELQARMLGYEVPPEPEPAPAPAPVAPVVVPQPLVAVAPPFDVSQAVPGSWGIRLVSTTPQAHPPTATLGLSNGENRAVIAGDLIPEERVVVLAIGAGMVQIAQIVPQGDHASVDTRFLTAMYP